MSDLITRQVEAIHRWLSVFHPPGSTVTVQALYGPRKARAVITGDLMEAARIAAEMDATDPLGVYFGLNPIRPDLAGQGYFPKDPDIVERRWLPIDVDPRRPSGTSSTEEETRQAWTVLDRCRGLLDGAGLTGAVVGFSGNGWQLCYPIQATTEGEGKELVRAVLKGLDERCGDTLTAEDKALLKAKQFLPVPKASIGTECHDAKRIWACYGTMKRKGTPTPERPHRWTRLVEGEPWQRTQAEANTQALAGLLASWRFAEDARRGRPQTSAESYALAALRQELAAIAGSVVGDRNNQLNRSAFALGQLVGSGALGRGEVEAALLSAGQAAGLPEGEARATIRSGLESGLLQPRDLSQVGAGRTGPPSSPLLGPPPDPGERIIRFAGEIEPRRVSWLWPWRIPDAKLTTFAGQTGQGKTLVACDIVARVTRGGVWPDGKPGDFAGKVLFLTGDDDFDDTLVPRLIDAGADLDQVVFLTEKAQASWTMAALATLDQAIAQAGGGVRLVVIDPPTSFLLGIDDHKNAELRTILTPFKDWAKRNGIAVILITHLNKGGGAQLDAMLRVMGSVAWVTGVRAAYMFAPDPETPDRQLFLTLKNNLGPKAKALAYRIVPGEWTGQIEWLGEVDTTADEAISKTKKGPGRGAVASEWLIERFRERLEWQSQEIFDRGKQEGISRDAIFQAKRLLSLPKPRKLTGQDGSVSWTWWVPSDWPQLSHSTNGATVATDEPKDLPW